MILKLFIFSTLFLLHHQGQSVEELESEEQQKSQAHTSQESLNAEQKEQTQKNFSEPNITLQEFANYFALLEKSPNLLQKDIFMRQLDPKTPPKYTTLKTLRNPTDLQEITPFMYSFCRTKAPISESQCLRELSDLMCHTEKCLQYFSSIIKNAQEFEDFQIQSKLKPQVTTVPASRNKTIKHANALVRQAFRQYPNWKPNVEQLTPEDHDKIADIIYAGCTAFAPNFTYGCSSLSDAFAFFAANIGPELFYSKRPRHEMETCINFFKKAFMVAEKKEQRSSIDKDLFNRPIDLKIKIKDILKELQQKSSSTGMRKRDKLLRLFKIKTS